MPQVDAIHAPSALHRAIMDRKYHTVSLAERHNNRPRLHARALLCHHEFAASEVFFRLRQQNGKLERENVFAIKVLVQAVVIAGAVLE